jgi:parallel beta-helix repeat protein
MIVSHKELYYIINMESIHDSQIIANNISRIIRTNFHGVPGMTIDKCEDLNISQNFISSVDIGIALRSSNNCEIHLNQLRHISDIGFYVWYSDNNIFQANSFANVSRNIYVNGMGNIFIDNCNLISPTWITTDTPIFQRNYTVNWNIVPNVDFYEVWVNETQVGTTLELYFQIIFPEDGLYYISLVAVNESGRSGFSDILEMHVNNGIYLSIEIEGNNDNAIYVGNLVHFACIFNGGNDHLSFSWDFGDLSPLDTGSNVSHIYKSSGNYLVTHTVTDANGINSSVAVIIEILPKELFGGIPGYPVEIIVLLTICSICLPFLKIFREKR